MFIEDWNYENCGDTERPRLNSEQTTSGYANSQNVEMEKNAECLTGKSEKCLTEKKTLIHTRRQHNARQQNRLYYSVFVIGVRLVKGRPLSHKRRVLGPGSDLPMVDSMFVNKYIIILRLICFTFPVRNNLT